MSQIIPRGPLLGMIAGAAFISLTGVLVEYAHVPPTVSAFWRMLFGGSILVGALAVSRQWRAMRWSDVVWMVPPALAFATDLYFWHRSILDIGPGLATLLGNLQVFIMALAGVLLHREKLSWQFLVGLLLSFVGLWLLVGQGWSGFGSDYKIGVLFGIFTAFCYATYMLFFRHAQRERSQLASTQLLATMSLLCAGVLALIISCDGEKFAIPDTQSLVALVALGLVGQCLGWVFISRAMPQLPTSLVGLLLLLQPILAFLMDVILFHRYPADRMDWSCAVALRHLHRQHAWCDTGGSSRGFSSRSGGIASCLPSDVAIESRPRDRILIASLPLRGNHHGQ